MPTPPIQNLASGPPRAPRKGPNPFLIMGLVVLSSLAFFSVNEKRQSEFSAKGQKPVQRTTSPWMRSGTEGEKIDLPSRRSVE